MLDPEDGLTIKRGQQLLTNSQLKTDLAFIDVTLSFLSLTFVELERQGLPFSESIGIMQLVKTELEKVGSDVGHSLATSTKRFCTETQTFLC